MCLGRALLRHSRILVLDEVSDFLNLFELTSDAHWT